MPHSSSRTTRPVVRISTTFLPSSSRKTTPSTPGSLSPDSRYCATCRLLNPVTRAPVSMRAWNGGSAYAIWSRRDVTDQPGPSCTCDMIAGLCSVCIISPSVPCSYPHRPSSRGSRSEGVPLKPNRRWNSMSPPTSCPDALSFTTWWGVWVGNTHSFRYQWMTSGRVRNRPNRRCICASLLCLRNRRDTTSPEPSASLSTSTSPLASTPASSPSAAALASGSSSWCTARTRMEPPASSTHRSYRWLALRNL
mmetsp:Transcript_70148/g.123668  ORF Transcript_70148/g.123668 Transcript_70148/m.123668 type:complete len:251 (-) Transcript_70148:9548-10300(-)